MKIKRKRLLTLSTAENAYCVSVDHPAHEVAIVGKSGKAYRCGQTVNFGLIYKMHYTSLAKKLKISEEEAERYVHGYFVTYKGVGTWQKMEILRARKYGRTRTILGRPREFPEINDHNKWIREKKERESINHPVQGSAGEICKLAMIDTDNSKELQRLKCYLLMQIHDELVFKCPKENAIKAVGIIRKLMENSLSKRGVKFDVPIMAEGGIGNDWLAAKSKENQVKEEA